MFCVDEPTASAIRKAFEENGELSAAIELRRHFPGIADNENALLCVRSIARWAAIATPASETGIPDQIIAAVIGSDPSS
jgi:hypothetical protein